MITICFTYFRGLTLRNLEAALYSIWKQRNVGAVKEMILVDNNTDDSLESIEAVIDQFTFPYPVTLRSYKHGNPTKTHPWSTNVAVREVKTPWIFFTRADYLLEFEALSNFTAEALVENRFIVSRYYDVGLNIETCELTRWRVVGPGAALCQHGVEYHYTEIDSGVWMTTKKVFDSVGGLNENLYAWGHAQTAFQYMLHKSGVEFVKVPHLSFFHPSHHHEAGRDHSLASRQLEQERLDLKTMWARYQGPNHPYQ